MQRITHSLKAAFTTSFLALLLSCLALTGCSSGAKKALVGKWSGPNGQVEFFDDGKMTTSMGSMSVSGTYTLVDDTHLKMDVEIGGKQKSKTMAYAIKDDVLTTDEDGKKDEMKRVK